MEQLPTDTFLCILFHFIEQWELYSVIKFLSFNISKMKVSELMQELMKHNEPGAEIRLAWYSNGNYNVTDDFELTIYKDSYEDEKGDIITSRDIVLDLGDLNL